ncbi:MAG: C45 family peptidase [Anaerolineae bacterium]|nr:C45 family peptidase [Anaerolineae bacterium]
MCPLPELEVGGSHFEVGQAIGQHFSAQIQRSLESYPLLQKILPYHRTSEGQARYRELLGLNRARYPEYLAELEGIAQGADHPFEELFLANLRGEYRGYLPKEGCGCFDCAVVTEDAALLGHNEDGLSAFRDNLYVIHAQVEDKPAFTALSYPGFLCGNAFGFNAAGICFSCDSVHPQQIVVGIGRHLLARSLLEATSLEDAIRRVTVPGRASGFSYSIGSISERRIVHVEVAPQTHHVREVEGCYLHANHYRELDVAQVVGASSRARIERATELVQQAPPRDAEDVLSVLGDQGHERYPIYGTDTPSDRSATLCTGLFDLDAPWLRIYTSRPGQTPAEFVQFAMA